jgi:hypothetical protein
VKRSAYVIASALALGAIPLSWLGASLVRKESQYWPNSLHHSMPWSGALHWVLITYLFGAVTGLASGSSLAVYWHQYAGRPFTPINGAFWCGFVLICFISFCILPKCI